MQAAKEEFLGQLADPQRQMIGAQQVADVRQAVQDSGEPPAARLLRRRCTMDPEGLTCPCMQSRLASCP